MLSEIYSLCAVMMRVYSYDVNPVDYKQISAPAQVRFAHTDVQVPDFSAYRRDGVKDNYASSQPSASGRRAFTYLIVGGTFHPEIADGGRGGGRGRRGGGGGER